MIDRRKEAKNLKSVLFIYSDADKWTTISMGERLHKNCGVQSELWTVNNAKHAEIMKSEHVEIYKQKILDYFEKEIATN